MENFFVLLGSQGFDVVPSFNGEYQRFDRSGKVLNGWFRGYTLTTKSGRVIYKANYGDWSTGEKYSWSSDENAQYSKEEIQEIQAQLEAQKKRDEAELNKRREQAAEDAKKILAGAGEANPAHPYLVRKKVPVHAGLKQINQDLIIPIYNRGEICSLQFIDAAGSKKFLPGGRLKGSYYVISANPSGYQESIYFCEGYATGASVHDATGSEVWVCFNAGNLQAVAEYWAGVRGPENKKCVVLAADNDSLTPENPGITYATFASKYLKSLDFQSYVTYPQFTPEEAKAKNTDFNDAVNIYGLDSVKSMLQKAKTLEHHKNMQPKLAHQKNALPEPRDFTQLRVHYNKAGTPQKPPQSHVVNELASGFGDLLMREGREVFLWLGTHWQEQNPVDFRAHVKGTAQYIRSGLATNGELDDIFQLFLEQIPSCAPHSFYKQLPTVCNFQDGTLEIVRSGREYKTKFREHRRGDLITWILPYEYRAPRPANEKFDAWLGRCFAGDPDQQGKIRALKQIGGACLISMFPRLAFLYGPSKTGKSTFAKLCMAFVGGDNYSTTLPEKMSGAFGLEPMINKRINVCTDLSDARLDKGLFKRWEDALEQQVNRKGRQEIKCRLPNLHIYCTNELPRGIDGSSGAMDERVTVVEFSNPVNTGERVRDFEQELLDAGPGAILDFFEQGLLDLCASGGFFFNPDSGRQKLVEWKKLNSNLVEQFFDEIRAGNVGEGNAKLEIDASLKIKQKDLCAAFISHFREWGFSLPSRNELYAEVRRMGYQTRIVDGYPYFYGFGVRGSGGESHSF